MGNSIYRVCSIQGQIHEIVKAMQMISDKLAQQTASYRIIIMVQDENIECLVGNRDTSANIAIGSQMMHNILVRTIEIYGNRENVHSAINVVVNRFFSLGFNYNRLQNPTSQSKKSSKNMTNVQRNWLNSTAHYYDF